MTKKQEMREKRKKNEILETHRRFNYNTSNTFIKILTKRIYRYYGKLISKLKVSQTCHLKTTICSLIN
jgi:hypothetical protein